MTNPRFRCLVVLILAVAIATHLAAQVQTEVPSLVPGAKAVTVEHIKIHGTALEGNLEGNAIDRDVLVFLPPSYRKDKHRHYPVVYALHGYSIGAEQWSREIHVPQTIEGAFAQTAKEMIVVLPDSKTLHNVRCIRVRLLREILNSSLRTIWWHTSTLITTRSHTGPAVAWLVTPWEDMAQRASV